MKQYLNSANLSNLAAVGYLLSIMHEFKQTATKQDWSTEVRRNVSSAATYLDKAYVSICDQLDPSQGKTLVNQLQSWRGAKFSITRPSLIQQKHVFVQELIKDDWLDVVSHCIEGPCRSCLATKNDKCHIREIFLKYDVDVNDEQTEGCPYRP